MADDIEIRDKNAATVVLRATDNAGVKSPHHIIGTLEAGIPTPVSAAAPLPTSVTALPTGLTDAFSRVRVSEPRPIGDYNLSYGLEPLLMEEINSGSGNDVTFNTNSRMAELTLGGTTVGHSKLQSYQYHYYQPGRSHAIFMTGVFGTAVANTVKRIGYFDDNNGVFFQQAADGTWGVGIRSKTSGSVVDTVVTAASWSHQPGWAIDATNNVIFAIDLQFLGMGLVRCYEDRGGVLTLLHQFENEQAMAVPYMQTATLPVRAEIVQTTTAAAAVMKFKCASVMTEGGTDDAAGLAFSRESGSVTAGNNARVHALSIQPSATFGGIDNRLTLEIESVDVIVTGNTNVLVELCIGDSITGTTAFNAVNATHSGMEYNVLGTTSATPTAVLLSAFVATGNTVKGAISRKMVTRYPITLDAAGAARANGRLTVLVTGLGATSACRVALNWREIR